MKHCKSIFSSVPYLFLFALAFSVIVQSPSYLKAQQESTPPASSAGVEQPIKGMWVWRSQWFETAEARQALIAFAQEHDINRLMVQIHRDRSGDELNLRFPSELTALLQLASTHNIAVEALDGDPAMATAANQTQSLSMLGKIIDFNQQLPESQRFAGIHYDIEPYVGSMRQAWQDPAQRPMVMRDLIAFLHRARAELVSRGSQMTLAADIPFWYDSGKYDLTLAGRTAAFHVFIQDACDYVGIMSYRRKMAGSNSVLSVIENEQRYAASVGKVICASLETVKLSEDPVISFFGLPADALWSARAELLATAGNQPGFGGVLLHSYRGLQELIEASEK